MEELEALFGGVLATGSKNWSSGGVIASGAEESSTHSTSMPSETSISLEEDEDLPRNTNDEAEGSKKKQKKGKKEQTQEEMNRIMNVLENFEGPSVKECMKILKRLLTYEDPLYYVAINAFCKKKEYREVWMEMESDEERMRWIQACENNFLNICFRFVECLGYMTYMMILIWYFWFVCFGYLIHLNFSNYKTFSLHFMDICFGYLLLIHCYNYLIILLCFYSITIVFL